MEWKGKVVRIVSTVGLLDSRLGQIGVVRWQTGRGWLLVDMVGMVAGCPWPGTVVVHPKAVEIVK